MVGAVGVAAGVAVAAGVVSDVDGRLGWSSRVGWDEVGVAALVGVQCNDSVRAGAGGPVIGLDDRPDSRGGGAKIYEFEQAGLL